YPLLTSLLLFALALCSTHCVKSTFENGKILEAEMEMIQPKRFEKILAIAERQEQAATRNAEMPAVEGALSDNDEKSVNGDVLLLGSALLMALATLGIHRRNKKRVDQMTRWAKANPVKAQWLIAGLQLPLLSLGVLSGYNLRALGLEISDTMPILMAGIMTLGFSSVPFLPKRKTIAMPKKVFRQRLAYLGITLSSLMMAVGIGNRVVDKYPDSPVSHVIKKADQTIFSDSDTHKVEPVKTTSVKKHHKFGKKLRLWVAGGSCVLAVLLIILLIPVICAGICLVIGGFAVISESVGWGLLAILGGVGITWLGIKGIAGAAKWCKNKTTTDEKT
ncbi:MAG TPA: hypothetical protein DCF33_19760, partial [Saprospirales bacterium]|nr:hypothetical protein [Saprospirales bacterium]